MEIMPEIDSDSSDPKEIKLKKKKLKKESTESEYTLEIDGEEYDLVEVKMDGKDDNNPDQKCWKGYVKRGTKKKGGKEVNNCVKAGFEFTRVRNWRRRMVSMPTFTLRESAVSVLLALARKTIPLRMPLRRAARTAKKEEYVAEKKLDPVGKEDGDVDNDGDKDKSDKYLMNRRRAIAKAIGKKRSKSKWL